MSSPYYILTDLHYLPTYTLFKQLYHAKGIILDLQAPYQKKSYQNRCYIATAQGLQRLVVPIQGASSQGAYQDVFIDYTTPWVRQHLKALAMSYGKTPYHLFFSDLITPLLTEKPQPLWRLSLGLLQVCFRFLQVEKSVDTTLKADFLAQEVLDLRHQIHPKKSLPHLLDRPSYFQEEQNGEKQLSIVDLLCRKGPEGLRTLR